MKLETLESSFLLHCAVFDSLTITKKQFEEVLNTRSSRTSSKTKFCRKIAASTSSSIIEIEEKRSSVSSSSLLFAELGRKRKMIAVKNVCQAFLRHAEDRRSREEVDHTLHDLRR